MFTGIIKELGKVRSITRSGSAYRLEIEAPIAAKAASEGDSVAVNGACLTVVDKKGGHLYFDVMEETLRKTTMNFLKAGETVHIEGALKVGDQLGGHFVLGHIDCVGAIKHITKTSENYAIDIEVPGQFSALLVDKGSIAIDGISLTVSDVAVSRFKVYIIPHTLTATTLGAKKAGDRINCEFDILGKYVLRSQEAKGASAITDSFLKGKGFL